MSLSFTEKQLVVTILLDGEQMSFPGFATTVHIQKQGAPELPRANVQIFGLSEAKLAQLTLLSFDGLSLRPNRIQIMAGDSESGMSICFEGEITNSAPDFNAAPSPVLNIEAITAAYPKLLPQSPVSISGSQAVEDLMESLASEAGLTFRNEGISTSLSNCTINGDPISKMQWVSDTIGADLIFDDKEVILVPRDGTRGQLLTVTAINPQTGQIGYPSFDSMGIRCSCFFRPDLMVAGYCRIESSLPRASGVWKIYSVDHDLSANLPSGGPWTSTISGTWMESA
jgi:hypothetical protein